MVKVSTKDLLLWIKSITSNDINGDAESLYLLLDLVGGISKVDLNLLKINYKDYTFLKEDLNIIKNKWLEFKSTKKPIQYICGKTFWRNYKILLSNYVLIPRVETEQIVDIISSIYNNPEKKLLFADLGTGSGVIAISLSLLSKNWHGLATDVDCRSINLAKRNFQRLSSQSNLDFYQGSWWDPLRHVVGQLDFVVSNPPYIPDEVYEKLPSMIKDYEPRLALSGGNEGLSHIVKIILDAPKYLKKGGWIFLENHFDQGERIQDLLRLSGFDSIRIIQDFFGIGRFTIGRYK